MVEVAELDKEAPKNEEDKEKQDQKQQEEEKKEEQTLLWKSDLLDWE